MAPRCTWVARLSTNDIVTDPLWEDYRDLAVAHGLRACWSTPILSPQKKVLGSFAMYYGAPRAPSREELRLIETAADIAGIAIEHQRSQEALRQSEERNRAILRAIPDWMFILSTDGVFLDYHVKNPKELLVPPELFLGKSMHEVLPPSSPRRIGAHSSGRSATNEPERLEYSLELAARASVSTKRASFVATATRCSASSGTSPTANAPSSMPPRNARSSRI